MSKQVINIGQTANDKSGDPLRTAFNKINENFNELYSAIGADVQIPAQTGNTGKYLTTNGTSLSWTNVIANGGSSTFDTITVNNGVYGAHTAQVGYRFSDYFSAPSPVPNTTNTYQWGWMDTTPSFVMNQVVVAFQAMGATGWTIRTKSPGGTLGTPVTLTGFLFTDGSNKSLRIYTNQALDHPLGWDSALMISPNYAPATSSPLTLHAGNSVWTVGTDNTLTFPDSTIQSTAWTGSTDRLTRGDFTAEIDANGYFRPPYNAYIGELQTSVIYSNIANTIRSVDKDWTFDSDGNLNVPGHILSQNELHVVGGDLTGIAFNRWTPSTTPGDINSIDFTAEPSTGAIIRTVKVASDQSVDSKAWYFKPNGTLELPTGGTIKQGLQQITIDDTAQTVTIQTGFNNPVYGDFFRTWTFHNNGTIYLPGDSGATIHGETDSVRIYSDTATHNGVDIESNAFTSIVNQNSVIIQTNAGSGTVTKWTFGQDGTITFPDTTHQTTAWTGITNALPSQTGNNGKYLTTNGSGTLSWGTVSGGITASSSDTLTNKTINIQTGQGNTFQIQGNSITSYSGSGSIVPLTSMPTFYGLNTGDSGLTLDGGTGNYYWKPTAFDGTGTIHKSGVYKSSFDADNALFTLGANGAGTMSLAVEGSLFIGNGVPSNSGGLNTNYSGWLVVQAGAKFGGDLNTTGGLHFDNDASGYIQFQNGNVFKVTTVPVHSYGVSGDVAGLMAFDANYIYYCKQAYVNNSTNIWVRVAWSGTTW